MASADTDIRFSQLGIGSVLKEHLLVVPPNQREYSWTIREIRTLFQDLARAVGDEDKSYFLGTVITIPKRGGILEVSDGQQRLATTAILLSAIRDYLFGKDQLLVDAIQYEFLTGIQRGGRARVPKLRLNVDDNEYFRARLTKEGATPPATKPSHKLLAAAFDEAAQRVRDIVSGFHERDHGDQLNRWIDFIQWKAVVGLLEVQDENSAYRMFETLNDRGLRISQADLVKNYLFGRAGSRQTEVQQKWAFMRGTLETMEEEDITITFLRHALVTMRGLVRQSQVYEAVQDQAKAPQQAVAFSGHLEALAATYVAIDSADHERWNGYSDATRRAIEVLNLFGIVPMRPLILAIAHKFTDRQEIERALRACVSACVRLMIVGGTRTGVTEEGMADAAHKVSKGDIGDSDGIAAHLRTIVPNDERFRLVFETATVSNAGLARYYLRSLEMAAKGEAEPWHIPNDDRNIINLEHILPVKPEDNWPQFSDELGKVMYRRVGNLALLRVSENSGLKSLGFEEKRGVYARSPYLLTQQIAEAPEWTAETITDRQKTLASYALKAWPFPWK